jgi:hypothetical protein
MRRVCKAFGAIVLFRFQARSKWRDHASRWKLQTGLPGGWRPGRGVGRGIGKVIAKECMMRRSFGFLLMLLGSSGYVMAQSTGFFAPAGNMTVPRVREFSCRVLRARDCEFEFFAKCAADESSNAVCLPARDAHEFVECCAVGSVEERDYGVLL